MASAWTCGHQVLKDLCGRFGVPVSDDAVRELPVVGKDGASSPDMVRWLTARGFRVQEARVFSLNDLAPTIPAGSAAFVATRLDGAVRLHWVMVRRVIEKNRLVEISDARSGVVVERQQAFLRKCVSLFWVVRRESHA